MYDAKRMPDPSPPDTRSARTRARLVDAALESLIEIGYARATGVEVCRRAGLTRGALQHHFPVYGELLAAALSAAYQRTLEPVDTPEEGTGPLEQWVHRCNGRSGQREFKAIIELWLGARNDPEMAEHLDDAIAHGSALFSPSMLLKDRAAPIDDETDAIYRTILEAFIGLALGRAVNGFQPLGHEDAVVEQLLLLARRHDEHTNDRHHPGGTT